MNVLEELPVRGLVVGRDGTVKAPFGTDEIGFFPEHVAVIHSRVGSKRVKLISILVLEDDADVTGLRVSRHLSLFVPNLQVNLNPLGREIGNGHHWVSINGRSVVISDTEVEAIFVGKAEGDKRFVVDVGTNGFKLNDVVEVIRNGDGLLEPVTKWQVRVFQLDETVARFCYLSHQV